VSFAPQGAASARSSSQLQKALTVSQDPACSPRTTAAQDALLHDHFARDLLGHLRVAEGLQSTPTRLCGSALMCLRVLGLGGGLREEAAS
jgi:hypothetical protein